MKRSVIFLLLQITFMSICLCQVPSPDHYLVSPNAAALGEYGEIPVSLYTGIPEISLPVYTMNTGNHNLSVSLSYHGGGVRPDRHPGWVGLGWTLNCGGNITRVVKGLPDESNWYNVHMYAADYILYSANMGYFNYASSLQSGFMARGTDEPSKLKPIVGAEVVEKYYDSEPDQYIINLPGITGSFYYDHNNRWVVQSNKPIKVVFDVGYTSNYSYPFDSKINDQFYACRSRSINNFQIVDDYGTIYTFGGKDKPEAIEYSVGFFTQDSEEIAATTWHLTSIKYMDGREITFDYTKKDFIVQFGVYENYTKQNIDKVDYIYCNGRCLADKHYIQPYDPNYDYAQGSVITPSYLHRVSDGYTEIFFDTSESNELNYDIKRFYYNHYKGAQPSRLQGMTYLSHYNADGSLCAPLTNIDQCAEKLKWHKLAGIRVFANKQLCKEFSFTYNDADSPAQKQRLALMQFTEKYPGTSNTVKSYGFEYDRLGELPAYCSYDVDHWDFYTKTGISDNGSSYNTTQRNISLITEISSELGVENPDTTGFGNISGDIFAAPAGSLESRYVRARNTDPKYGTIGSLLKIKYPTGGYSRFEYEGNVYSAVVDSTRTALSLLEEDRNCGGIRIKKIFSSDDGTTQGEYQTKEYLYYDAFSSNKRSSGILCRPRQYRYDRGDFEWESIVPLSYKIPGSVIVYSSQSLFPMATNGDGCHITYSKVTEKNSDGTMSVFHFTNFDDGHTDEAYMGDNAGGLGACFPYSSKAQERGLLKLREDYDTQGRITGKTIHEYSALGDTTNLLSRKACYHGYSIILVGKGQNESFIKEIYDTKIYTYTMYPVSSITEKYSNGVLKQTGTSKFTYDKYYLPHTISETYSNGLRCNTKLYYPHSGILNNRTLLNTMESWHCRSTLLSKLVKTTLNYGYSKTDSISYLYKSDNLAYPYEIHEFLNNNTIAEKKYYSYDNLRNIASITDADGEIQKVYVWGYRQQYPVAAISDAGLEEVEGVIGDINTFGEADEPDFDKLKLLFAALPYANVTLYKYKPGIGISEIMQADGTCIRYNYDSAGRLTSTCDTDGNYISVHDYNYSGPDNYKQ